MHVLMEFQRSGADEKGDMGLTSKTKYGVFCVKAFTVA